MSLISTNRKRLSGITRLFVKFLVSGKSVKVGKNVQWEGIPCILVTQSGHVEIGNDVIVRRHAEIRCHNNARLIIEDGAKIDRGVRVLACFEGEVRIRTGAEIGFYSILNGAGGIDIGENAMIGGYVNIQASKHRLDPGKTIKAQGSDHLPVKIGADTWLGAHSTVVAGITIGKGSVVGANSVVTHDIPEYEIWAGVPARHIKNRI